MAVARFMPGSEARPEFQLTQRNSFQIEVDLVRFGFDLGDDGRIHGIRIDGGNAIGFGDDRHRFASSLAVVRRSGFALGAHLHAKNTTWRFRVEHFN